MSRYQFPDHKIRLDYVMNTIKRLDPKSVVDFGCGVSPIQEMPFVTYMGIDTEDYNGALNKVLSWRTGYSFLKADFTAPLETANFIPRCDLALWLEGPEHTLKHGAVFANIRNALCSRGFLIITCPNEGRFEVFKDQTGEHKCSFDLPTLITMVETERFTVLEAAYINCAIEPASRGYNWLFCLATNNKYDPRYVE